MLGDAEVMLSIAGCLSGWALLGDVELVLSAAGRGAVLGLFWVMRRDAG